MVEGSADFYASRVPKRQRKSNMIDELLSDAEFRRYVHTTIVWQALSIFKHWTAFQNFLSFQLMEKLNNFLLFRCTHALIL